MRLPIPRDLKEPDGWRFSSLRKMRLYINIRELMRI